MNDLENFIFEQAKCVIQKISKDELSDIYVYSFYLSDIEDDMRRPCLTIGYNTATNFNQNIDNASSSNEARWNYAFWLQNEMILIGEDDHTHDLIKEWIKNQDLYYTNEEEDKDFYACLAKGEKIKKSFISILINVVRRLHKEHITELPVLIHELEYYDEIKEQNILANGIDRVKEFTSWIDSGMG